jgi:integrase
MAGTKMTKKRKPAERMKLDRKTLDTLRSSGQPNEQRVIWDEQERGLQVLISRGGEEQRLATVTFRTVYYMADDPGRPRYQKIGRYPDDISDIKAVRDEARRIRVEAAKGLSPKRAKLTGDIQDVVDHYITEIKTTQRTWEETERIFKTYVTSKWADRKIESLDWKADINPHLNQIAEGKYKLESGKLGTPTVALSVRSQLTTFFNWYVEEHGSKGFRSPMIKSRKTKTWRPKARKRSLSDDEIRVLWTACDEIGDAYSAAVRCGLLCAQRFHKVAGMRRRELKRTVRIDGYMQNGTWVEAFDIPHVWDATRADDPENKRVSIVPLQPLVREIIDNVQRIDADKGTDHIFTSTGRGPLRNWSRFKLKLDQKMTDIMKREATERGDDPKDVEVVPWQFRDLRRTARTIMARLGIDHTIAEECVAHARPKMDETYNVYSYAAEKRKAFAALADHIASIVSKPPIGSKVHKLGGRHE